MLHFTSKYRIESKWKETRLGHRNVTIYQHNIMGTLIHHNMSVSQSWMLHNSYKYCISDDIQILPLRLVFSNRYIHSWCIYLVSLLSLPYPSHGHPPSFSLCVCVFHWHIHSWGEQMPRNASVPYRLFTSSSYWGSLMTQRWHWYHMGQHTLSGVIFHLLS